MRADERATSGARAAAGSSARRLARAAIATTARLPDARAIRFPDAAHEILRERDAVRDRALAAIDAFLDERAPAA